MLRFCGFDLELVVEDLLPPEARGGWPVVYSARDGDGSRWLIVQVDDDPLHMAWLCAPISERALVAVVAGRGAPTDALRHSLTGVRRAGHHPPGPSSSRPLPARRPGDRGVVGCALRSRSGGRLNARRSSG